MQRTIPTIKETEGLIRYMSNRFANLLDIDRSEAKSDAYLTYITCKEKFRKEEAKFNTFFYKCTLNECLKSLKDRKESLLTEDIAINNQAYKVDPETQYVFKETLESLSPDCKKMINMILQSPQEFYLPGSPKLSRGHVYRKLEEQGWPYHKIWATFREVKEALKK